SRRGPRTTRRGWRSGRSSAGTCLPGGVELIGHGAVCGAGRGAAHTSGTVKAILDSQLNAASRPKISRIMKTTNSRTVIEYRTSSRRVGTTTFRSSAMTCRMNRPIARNGFFDPEPGTSAPLGVDGAFWLEFTLGCPISSRSSASGRVTPTGPAGQTGLEPATCGFGDRCATNCATALHEDQASCGRCTVSRRSSAARTSDQHTSRTGLVRIRRQEITPQRDAGHSIPQPAPRPCSARSPACALRDRRCAQHAVDGVRTVAILAVRAELCHDGRVTTDDASIPATSPQTSQHARISKRVGAIEPSATLAVDATAKALKAAGRPVIGFGAGEPDFSTPQHIVDAAIEAAQDPRNHRYSATGGLPELREALAESFSASTGLEIDPAQVLVTNGGKQAVFQTFAT